MLTTNAALDRKIESLWPDAKLASRLDIDIHGDPDRLPESQRRIAANARLFCSLVQVRKALESRDVRPIIRRPVTGR